MYSLYLIANEECLEFMNGKITFPVKTSKIHQPMARKKERTRSE